MVFRDDSNHLIMGQKYPAFSMSRNAARHVKDDYGSDLLWSYFIVFRSTRYHQPQYQTLSIETLCFVPLSLGS